MDQPTGADRNSAAIALPASQPATGSGGTSRSEVPMHPAVSKIRHLEAELNSYLIGREYEIRGALLALASRQHAFYLGPPGSGKSYMVSEIARRIRGEEDIFFLIEFNAFILREEIFGPISLRAMREHDSLARKYHGFLPSATVAQLDELWEAPPALLNTLLRLLNEREFRNDELVLRSPLISAFVSSNKLPPSDRSLDALYDRILLRYDVKPLTDVDARRKASLLRLAMRAFESEVDAHAESLHRARARQLSEFEAQLNIQKKAGDLDPEAYENLLERERARIRDQELPEDIRHPGRWIIDHFGELFSDEELRAKVATAEFTPPLPARLDREDVRELIERAAKWAHKMRLEANFRTFVDRRDLDLVYNLVLQVEFPDEVEAAFYRIIDSLKGSSSVRRETELRIVIAAQAVLEGRVRAAMEDLEVMKHALWSERKDIPMVAKAVDAETINLRVELDTLLSTLDAWEHQNLHEANISYADFGPIRRQREAELGRFRRLAEAYPNDTRVADAERRAKRLFEEYEEAVVGPGGNHPDPESGPYSA